MGHSTDGHSDDVGHDDPSSDPLVRSEHFPKPLRRCPADWEPLDSVWLAWPHNRETWPGRFEPIPVFFADLACLIARSVPVHLIGNESSKAEAADLMRHAKLRGEGLRNEVHRTEVHQGKGFDVHWHLAPTNDCWIRDHGPVWVHAADGSLVAVDFAYNAWGGKYPPWDDDQKVAEQIASLQEEARETSKLCLEGGALETDGLGRLVTTTSALLTSTRNPGWSQEDIATELYRRLGVTEIAWIEPHPDGRPFLAGDDTDGHIDQLARFVDPENMIVAVTDDTDSPDHESLGHAYRQLKLWAQSTQPRVTLHPVQIPPARTMGGVPVPQSYCNFLRLGPDRLLLPTFGTPETDGNALGVLRGLLPGAKMETVDCRDLSWGLGALHCASHQQPRPAATTD
ncbi:MAG: agmatine deiminase family protein [Planctomycetota bacterium]